MIPYLFIQFLLVGFNLVNVRHDAYRILNHKNIGHAVNFCAYAAVVALLCWLFRAGWVSILVAAAAFFNRQLAFDIPLNLRRGLPWYYQSVANPPNAVMDRIERVIFGNLSGKWIAAFYAAGWVACLIIKIYL